MSKEEKTHHHKSCLIVILMENLYTGTQNQREMEGTK